MQAIIVPKDEADLAKIIKNHIAQYGPNCDLNHIDVSEIRFMTGLFVETPFNGNVSQWDVRKVGIATSMFWESHFTGDLSSWYMPNLYSCKGMFMSKHFQGSLPRLPMSTSQGMMHKDYQGDARSLDSIVQATKVFGSVTALDNFLEATCEKGMTTLHVLRVLQLRNRVPWCPPATYKAIRETSRMCESLGINRLQWPEHILKRLSGNPVTEPISFDFE